MKRGKEEKVKLYFEWDQTKNISNQAKHTISFERAATIFNDPRAITLPDLEHSENEERWSTLGSSSGGTLLVVIHTFQVLSSNTAAVRIMFPARRSFRF